MARTNRHHILPRSRGGSNAKENIKIMDVNQHLDLHALFSNKTPLEQIKTIIDLNSSALTDIFKGELLALLRDYGGGLAYKDAVKLSSKDIKEILR